MIIFSREFFSSLHFLTSPHAERRKAKKKLNSFSTNVIKSTHTLPPGPKGKIYYMTAINIISSSLRLFLWCSENIKVFYCFIVVVFFQIEIYKFFFSSR
jgi:hypothetical protein